ncbi:aminoacyl-tRNA hydrolase [bacterium]|jgi:peptidyl-tRNA hydrolase, PTH1 family|nr:aminoacyl-tRNA hydrolase [bacterium]
MHLDFCVVGLGNPGQQYENTRHNAGFLALDYIRTQWGFNQYSQNKYHQAAESSGDLGSHRILLLKPQTYMNLSGNSLVKLKSQLSSSQFIILYDDFDLPLGSMRIKSKGSAGTHNGMKSILSQLHSKDVPRIRIGIHPQHPLADATKFVLNPFTRSEWECLEPVFSNIMKSLEYVFTGSLERAAREFNRKAL